MGRLFTFYDMQYFRLHRCSRSLFFITVNDPHICSAFSSVTSGSRRYPSVAAVLSARICNEGTLVECLSLSTVSCRVFTYVILPSCFQSVFRAVYHGMIFHVTSLPFFEFG